MTFREDGPMTQAQARASVKRAQEGLNWILEELLTGDRMQLGEACIEAIGAVAQIQEAIDDEIGQGIVDVWVPERAS